MRKFKKMEGFDYAKLFDYQQITNFLLDTNCDVHELGESSNGDMIYGLSVGDLSKPMILIDGTMHGSHEWRTAHWAKEFIERMAKPLNDKNKLIINELKNHVCIMVIPCLNTYGYLSGTYTNANGVNLNRNWPVGWNDYPIQEVGHSQFKGTEPFSEPESQILKNIVETHRVIGYVNCHTWGGYTGAVFETSSNGKEHHTLFRDIFHSLKLSTGHKDIQIRTREKVSTPWVTEWMNTVDNKSGENIIGVIFETGSLESNYQQAELGMTGLLIYCYSLYKRFKTRNIVLS